MGACLAAQTPSRAALVASDSAGNYTSWGPQANLMNLGTNFGNWSYINSTPNGGFADEFLGSSGINIGNGLSFGLLANSAAGSEAQAILPFLGGSLAENQMFSVQMQNGSVANDGGQVGFRLQNSSGGNIFQFYLNGVDSGVAHYYINVSGHQVDTGIALTFGALTLQYIQGSGNSWVFHVSDSFESATLSSDPTSTGFSISGANISQVDLFNLNGGPGRKFGVDNGNLYFNNFAITPVPEPITLALPIFGGVVLTTGLARRFISRRAKTVV